MKPSSRAQTRRLDYAFEDMHMHARKLVGPEILPGWCVGEAALPRKLLSSESLRGQVCGSACNSTDGCQNSCICKAVTNGGQ